jgi:hypothetical protein
MRSKSLLPGIDTPGGIRINVSTTDATATEGQKS